MMTPREIVHELNKHIIGQDRAKRAVAIALRNRWRRQHVEEPLRSEITPKNILMIGPTGVGKTEIARRLARLAEAPFIKVEATKFTEVGYVGRDVDSIVRDLVDIAVKQTREAEMKKQRARAEDAAEDRILDVLVPPPAGEPRRDDVGTARQKFRKKLREGSLDDTEIEIDLAQPAPQMEVMAPPGMEELTQQIQSMFANVGQGRRRSRRLRVREAFKLLVDEEAAKLVNEEELKGRALASVENNGIVFLDEIDKIAARSEVAGADVSRQGVQRDLLPLVEGTTVNTKYGMVKTDHILFIASLIFSLRDFFLPPPRFWNIPWICWVSSSIPGGAKISACIEGAVTSMSISLSSSSPSRSFFLNFCRVELSVAVDSWPSGKKAPLRAGGSSASRMRSSAASSARARICFIARSRCDLMAISTRSRMIVSTSRPT